MIQFAITSLPFLTDFIIVQYIYFKISGRFDVNHRRYKCLQCGKMLCTSEPLVIVQSGFWPGSIKDMTYVFDKELFLFWDILQKQLPGVSEGAFLKSLELFSKRKGCVSIFIRGHCPSTSNSGLEVL